MKKHIVTIVLSFLLLSIVQAQLKVTSLGAVGITTTTPQAALDLGTAKYYAGAPLFLMYNNDPTSILGGIKMGFYADNYGVGLNLNLVFPEDAGANKGLFTISAKPTSGTAIHQYFSIAGMTGNVGIGVNAPAYKLDVQGTVRFGTYGLAGSGWEQVILDWNTPPYGNPVLYPKADGQLLIGKGSTNRVNVQAIQVWATWFTSTSDERVKENIVPLQSSLQQINRLRAVRYNIKKSYVSDSVMKKKQDLRKNNIGFLAQEVEKIFPDLVTRSDSAGLYGINYIEMIPIIVDAIKEQSTTIDSLKTQIVTLNAQVADAQSCCKGNSKLKSNIESETPNTSSLTSNTSLTPNTSTLTTTIKLYQNAPNPFKESTTIKLEIPETIGSAMVCIYDLTGRQLKCLGVSGRGTTSVQIFANELTAGLYHYALIADGGLIDTKTMVLTN
jgi:hypothetical protein